MELSIIIPVKDDIRIKNCIESIDEQVEVIVAMNSATKEVKAIVEELNVKAVSIPEANLSKAYNKGIEAATFDRVLLMDSDCIFQKGTIRKLYNGSLMAKLSKGKVVFTHNSFGSRVVSKVREFTTSDYCNAFSPPLILHKSIKEDIGYYFNPSLKWEEDFDFNRRVFENNVKIYWDKTAEIYHPPLSIIQDLRSAYNYGVGHGIGIKAGIFSNDVRKPRNVRKAIRSQCKVIRKKKGLLAQVYYFCWLKCYHYGEKKEISRKREKR